MSKNIYLKNYKSILNVKDTQIAIKLVKDTFEEELASNLDLIRVSAPLFVDPKTGLNDELSGKEIPVGFKVHSVNKELQIIQSLAKWKRDALNKYNCLGLYTDMNAIRPYEELDNIHSLYVDQWDWEKVINKVDRNLNYLKSIVKRIYKAFISTTKRVSDIFPELTYDLPSEVTFITTSELEEKYPSLDRKQREYEICKEHKAIFLMQIGNNLKDGCPHDTRASDYDDWNLNGDFLVYYDVLDIALELSSMGIRVDSSSLENQLKAKNELYKLDYKYHKDVINNELPLTIGGGIGQSRLCLYILKKAHIGEVQVSYWEDKDIEDFKKININLL